MAARSYDVVALTSNDLVTDQRMQRCMHSLAGAGYRCSLLGRERPASQALPLVEDYDQERHRLGAHAGKRFYLELARAHYRRLLELRPRAVLAVDLDTVIPAARAAARLGIPWVYDAHELFTEQPEVARRPWIRASWSLVGQRYVDRARAAYTVGDAIARELTGRYQIPFEVVRNVPHTQARLSPKPDGPPPSPFTVLYQGALNEGRGLEELIDAARELPSIRVWIAGDGPLAADLRRRARDRRVGNVEFLGELPPERLRELTPRADLGYALMRDVSRNYYLSLSNKSLDYIHAGLPSMQMNWPEYAALDEQYGCYHLTDELSVEAVIDGVEACRELRYHALLREGCRRAAAELTWAREERRLLNIWREVLGDAP